jgi:60 kDa SS-A/Ro ribonucleoprotein
MNKNLFSPNAPDTVNEAGGAAYTLPPKAALAQLACTGTFADTFYVRAEDQLDKVLELAKEVDASFIARLAVYARKNGKMKDMPAVLVALLVCQGSDYADRIFHQVIDNGRMLRNFVQAMRSGRLGRRSLGSRAKRLVREWFEKQSPEYIFKQSVGNDPSMADVIKMAHPRPATPDRKALYGYLIGKEHNVEHLPLLVRQFEAFKAGAEMEPDVPDVPFQMVDSLPLTKKHWMALFDRGGYQFCRMNLNTALRHGLMDSELFVAGLAEKLRDPANVRAAKQMPYQFLAAYLAASKQVDVVDAIFGGSALPKSMPRAIIDALHDAMEVAVENVPTLPGHVVVAVDCSGSMQNPVTGDRGTATSSMRYVDVAGLFAAAVVRKNPATRVALFDSDAMWAEVEPRDTVLTTARNLARNGGATNCSAPLDLVNRQAVQCDLFIMISDDQSWVDTCPNYFHAGAFKSSVDEWRKLKKANPGARMVRINIAPGQTSQLKADRDVLLVGGFSDAVFDAVASFRENQNWVAHIETTML